MHPASGLHQNHPPPAGHQAVSILEEVKGVSMAGVGWRLASSMGSACRWAMSSRGERAHTASQRAGERAVRSGACGEDGGAWAAGAPGSRASSAASRASAPRRGAAAWACCERACQAAVSSGIRGGNRETRAGPVGRATRLGPRRRVSRHTEGPTGASTNPHLRQRVSWVAS